MRYVTRRFRLENGQREKGLRKMRRRTVKPWKARRLSIKRRRRYIGDALFLLAADTMTWVGTDRGIVRWVQEQIPHMVRIGENSPARAADRDGMTSVKRGFTIHLDEREVHIYRVEEGYKNRERSGDSGSD